MSLYEKFGTNKQKEVDGVWLEYGQNADGTKIRFLVARAGGRNQQFEKVADFVYKPVRRRIKMEDIEPSELRVLTQQIFARAVVKDWSGVRDREGNELQFNEQNFLAVMGDLQDLWEDIKEFAETMSNYMVSSLEADAKN